MFGLGVGALAGARIGVCTDAVERKVWGKTLAPLGVGAGAG